MNTTVEQRGREKDSELEKRVIEIKKLKNKRKRENSMKNIDSTSGTCGTILKTLIWICLGINEEEKEIGAEKILEEIM